MADQERFFQYGETELEYLRSRDARLAEVIDKTGHIDRPVDGDLFSSVVHHIVGQQISTKAQQTVWQRMNDAYGGVAPAGIAGSPVEKLQSFGMTFRKAGYIKEFSQKVLSGEFDLDAVRHMPDEEAIAALTSLKGVGVWTAEMILLFCLQRPDILSFRDLAIRRGMALVYDQKEMDRKLFEEHRRRLSPCGSVASLYFWAVAGGVSR